MRLREGEEAIAREDFTHPGSIVLVHVIDAQGEHHR
jgi:hypothetical protein